MWSFFYGAWKVDYHLYYYGDLFFGNLKNTSSSSFIFYFLEGVPLDFLRPGDLVSFFFYFIYILLFCLLGHPLYGYLYVLLRCFYIFFKYIFYIFYYILFGFYDREFYDWGDSAFFAVPSFEDETEFADMTGGPLNHSIITPTEGETIFF